MKHRTYIRIRRITFWVLTQCQYFAVPVYGAYGYPDDTLMYREWLYEHAQANPATPLRADTWWLD